MIIHAVRAIVTEPNSTIPKTSSLILNVALFNLQGSSIRHPLDVLSAPERSARNVKSVAGFFDGFLDPILQILIRQSRRRTAEEVASREESLGKLF